MKVLLTGATGFLGSHLARALLAEGHQIIALKRCTSDLWRLNDVAEQIEFHDLEGLDLKAPFERHGQIDVVIHTATCYGRKGETAIEIFEANTALPLRLLQTATFFNTDTILSAHLNQYALSKKQFAEWGRMLCSAGSTRFVNIRLEHMYGPGDDLTKFTSWIMQQCLDSVPTIELTAGEQLRDFIYVDDVVSAYQSLLSNAATLASGYAEVGVGSGDSVAIRSFAEKVHRLSSSKSQMKFGALPYREGEALKSVANIEALRWLGWSPQVSLDEGITATLRAMQSADLPT